MKNSLKKYYPFFISVFVFVFIFFIRNTPPFNEIIDSIDTKIISRMYYKNTDEPSKNIIIVQIDELTLSKLWRFPFDRKEYVPVISRLAEKWAAVIWMDIIFPEKSNPESDIILTEAFKKAWNVVIWETMLTDKKVEPAYELLKQNVANTWIVELDSIETIYSMPIFSKINDDYYQHFSTAILDVYYNYNKVSDKFKPRYNNKYYYISDSKKIPYIKKILTEKSKNNSKSTSAENEYFNFLINFKKNNKFERISFIDLYDNGSYEGKYKNFDFKDKIILIWATAKWIKDLYRSPLAIEYWVFSHANFINTVIQWEFMTYFNKYLEALIIFLLIMFSVYFNFTKSWRLLIVTNIVIITLFFITSLFVIINFFPNTILNYPWVSILWIFFSILFTNLARYLTENKDKIKLSESLSQYVSKDIAKEILSWAWVINLDGEEKEVAIFFSDIEGFTTISEKYTPKELVEFLREYLSLMTNIIFYKKWAIDKYEWDAIMALWWSFAHNDTMHENICSAALLQIKVLRAMNIKWKKRWIPNINIRIWINSGNAILWNIWSVWKKLEYTALGDNVNLASRLEWINKFYGTNICVSQEIVDKVWNIFIFRYLDTIKVKGKNLPVKIYELVWFKWEKIGLSEENIVLFEKAIKLYEVGEFKKAKTIFSKLVKVWDKPSAEYVRRCDFFVKNPPENWNGVWEMNEK